MSVRIKISYEHPEELRRVLKLLGPSVKRWKAAKRREGRFKNAYVELWPLPEPRAKPGGTTGMNKNLIPNSERSPEELREMGRKGGIASGEARRRKRELKKLAQLIIDSAERK